MVTTGGNQYFILEPGHQIVLEGGDEKVQITVLDKTRMVDGVKTRIVEEREWQDGELAEISLVVSKLRGSSINSIKLIMEFTFIA